MRILIISNMVTSPWGGSEQLWSDAAGSLVATGHQVTICIKDWGGGEHPKIKQLEQAGCTVVRRVEMEDRRPWSRAFGRFAQRVGIPLRSAMDRLAATRPDLVLISSGFPWMREEYWEPWLERNIPYIILVHVASEHWWPDDRNRREQVQGYSGARALYFVSEGNKKLISNQLLFDHSRYRIVRNTTNLREGQVMVWPPTLSGFKVAFVGRLEPAGKGCDILIAVLAQKKWRERDLKCSVFGAGGSSESMRGLATRLGAENVYFRGHSGSVDNIWAEHHALVLPSRYEGLPIVIVEAMLAGRMCIVTDVAGNSEMVKDGISGFVADAPTEKLFDLALERAWAARDRWEEMGQAAAKRARELVPRNAAAEFAGVLLEDGLK